MLDELHGGYINEYELYCVIRTMKFEAPHILIIYSLIIVCLISFPVTANLGTFQQFDCIQMRTISNSSAVNLSSVTKPSGETTFFDSAMSKNGKTFNYTYCSTNELGKYVYDYYDNEGNIYVNDFEVTPSGFENTLGFYFLILILSIGIILLGLYLRDAPITILGSFGLYFVGLYILFYGLDGIKDTVYTWATGLIILCLALYISIKSTLELITN